MNFLPSISRAALAVSAGGLLASAPAAWARLGESQAECADRYGTEVARTHSMMPGAVSVSYVKSAVRVRAEFMDDRAVFISFSSDRMTVVEWTTLLDANRGELSWSDSSDFAGRRFWIARASRGKDQRFASQYTTGNTGTLEIAMPEWIAAVKPAIKALNEAALAGSLPPPGSVAGGAAIPEKGALEGF